MSKQDYIDYLKSDDWRERRKDMMDEANWECDGCGKKATQLHHINYYNLGCECLWIDVVPLCTACHNEVHMKEEEGYEEYSGY